MIFDSSSKCKKISEEQFSFFTLPLLILTQVNLTMLKNRDTLSREREREKREKDEHKIQICLLHDKFSLRSNIYRN